MGGTRFEDIRKIKSRNLDYRWSKSKSVKKKKKKKRKKYKVRVEECRDENNVDDNDDV